MMDAYRHCEAMVRAGDKDRFLAILFAPAETRRHVLALYAFNLEVSRVRDIVSDPLPGEMRYQWWRDAITGAGHGDVLRHPVAAALLETIELCRLPRQAFLDFLEARTFDLYDDPMPGLVEFEGYAGETAAALIQLSAIALCRGADPGTATAAGHAGVTWALTGILRALPLHAARGQLFLPGDILARHGVDRADIFRGHATPELLEALKELRAIAREHLARLRAIASDIPLEAAPAFLHAALADSYLDRMDRPGYDPFCTRVDTPQWVRQWILWRNARAGARRCRPAIVC